MRLRLLMVCVVCLSAALAYGQDPGGPPQKEKKEEPQRRKEGAPGRDDPRGRSRGAAERQPDQAPTPSGPGFPGHPQWEYDVLSAHQVGKLGNDLKAGFNKLGEQGWELVSVEPAIIGPGVHQKASYYFKRPKGPSPRLGGMMGPGPGADPAGMASFGGRGMMPGGRGDFGRPGAPPAPPTDFHVVPLKHTRAQAVVQLLAQIHGPAQGVLRLAADDRTNALIVSGTEEQVRDLRKLVDQLESLPAVPAQDRPELRRKQSP